MADLKRRIVTVFSAENKAKAAMTGFRGDMDKTNQAMKRMAVGALAVIGVAGGIYGLKRAFDYVTKAAMKQEDALFLLEAALRAAGEYSAGAMKKFEEFAASIQQATVYGDEEVLALMQLMKSLGVTSAGLEQATKMAIGLAAATGRDVRSMSMYIALAQQGEFTMLRRYIPALRSTTDETEQLRIITEFAARGFKIAEAQADTTSGALGQMKNAIGDVAEAIGDSLLPYIKDLAKRTKEWAEINEELIGRKVFDAFELMALGAIKIGNIFEGWTAKTMAFRAGLKESLASFYEIMDTATNIDRLLKGLGITKWTYKEEALRLRQEAQGLMDAAMEYAESTYGDRTRIEKYFDMLRKRAEESRAALEAPALEIPALGIHSMEMFEQQRKIMADINDQLQFERELREGTVAGPITDAIEKQKESLKLEQEYGRMFEKEMEGEAERESNVAALADAYRSMRGEMGRMTKTIYAAEMKALMDLRILYESYGVDVQTLTAWYEEQVEILEIEYLKAVGGLAGGFKAAGMQIRREMKTWGDIAYEFSMTLEDSIARGLENTMRNFKDWKQQLLNVFEEIYWSAMRIAFIQPAAAGLAGMMTGAMGGMFGGLFGSAGVEAGGASVGGPGAGISTKLQYGGTVTKTGLAMVHEGETYTPANVMGGGSLAVHIHNEGKEKLEISHVEEYMLSDQRVIDITTRAMATDLKYKRSVAQAAR